MAPGAIGRATDAPDVPDLGLGAVPVHHHRGAVREGHRVRWAAVANERVEEHLLAEAPAGTDGAGPQLHPAGAVARSVLGDLTACTPIEPDTERPTRGLREEGDEPVLHGLLIIVEPAQVPARGAVLLEGEPNAIGISRVTKPLEGRGEQGSGAQSRRLRDVGPVHKVPASRRVPLRRLLRHGPLRGRGGIGVPKQDESIGVAPPAGRAGRHHRGRNRKVGERLRGASSAVLDKYGEAGAGGARQGHELDLEPGISRGVAGGLASRSEQDCGHPREADRGPERREEAHPLTDQEA